MIQNNAKKSTSLQPMTTRKCSLNKKDESFQNFIDCIKTEATCKTQEKRRNSKTYSSSDFFV